MTKPGEYGYRIRRDTGELVPQLIVEPDDDGLIFFLTDDSASFDRDDVRMLVDDLLLWLYET